MSNEVKFSAETLQVLKRLHKINQGLRFIKDSTELRSMNEARTQVAFIQIAEKLPRDFCVYDLGEFITVLNVIESPVLDFSNDKFVLVKSEAGTQKLRYTDGQPDLVTSYTDKDFKLPSLDVTLAVSGAQLKSARSAAEALKLPYVGFKGVDGKVFLSAFAKNNGDGNETNSYSIEIGETTETFDLFYKVELLSILDGDCTFEISKKKISKIENGKANFFIALDAGSSFQ